uniref:Obscurin like cytoskeletal adaptor 1b n=1 Tax=Myripristis murdjan TaxID=586833 RepID=A0A667Z7N4_9TELE
MAANKGSEMDVFGGAPRFLAYPRPVVVQSGTDAVLKCQIGGDPRPAVIWERNNEKIDPQGRYRVFEDGNVYNLIISAVTTEDSGQYICKAKNSIGETYAAATLRVEGEAQELELREENKPRFLIKPLSTRVGRGEDAVFSCKLWGNPRPEVVWEKDGRKLNEIFESTHFSVGYQDGGWFQLKIFKTRAPDGGVYTCKARNEFGEGLAGAVLLVDAGPGHEDEGNLKMFAVTEGKHAKFRCFVTGKPKPEIIWRKDGRLILSGRRYLLYEDREGYFTLKVLYCKQKDNGVYVCAASNTAGQTLSAVHLSVKEPPVRFKQPLIDLEVWERDLAVLECEVPEDSVPITWYLEDRRLQPGAKYGMEEWGTKRRLTIRDIGVDDDGIYLCEMADGGRSIAEVAVKGTIVRKLPRKVDVLEGENAAFCVEVEEEEMDIHWYKDGIELRETHQTILKSFGRTHILVFVNTMPQDSGLVTFFVGRSKTSSQLRVKAARHCPPSCPVGVQINTERANAALLSWVPAQDSRKNPPSGYVLERQEVGTGSQEWLQCLTTDSATSVEILGDSVPCEADYRFRICSVNKYGKSNNVEFPRAVHLVPVARIQAPLQDALVPEGQDALFSIELSASVIGTWFLNGTQLQEDERYSMRRSRTHQSLRIRGVRDTDNGAEITFIAYGIRDSAALYIQAPLVKFSPLSEMDRNKFVEVGNPIVLYCELSDPAAPVHWYKNGVEIQTMEGLHIQSEGTMRRIVIQSAERNTSVEVGDPIVLRCEISDPNAEVTWYKDGVELLEADFGQDMQSDGSIRTLSFQSAMGLCFATFGITVFVSLIIYIFFFTFNPVAQLVKFSALSEADQKKTVMAGCPIVLQCELSDPSGQVYWYKDGSNLLPQNGVDIRSNGNLRSLVIQSAEQAHSGVYRCEAKDDDIQFTVEVKERYKFIAVGSPIILQCELSDPTAQVSWFKDEVELFSKTGLDMKRDGNFRKLMIHSAKVSDSGLYSCRFADDVVTFQVEVEALTEVARNKCVEAGCPITLQCEVTEPAAQVYWCKDGVELLPQDDLDIQSKGKLRAVVIKSAEVKHSGVYSCEAADDHIEFKVDVAAPVWFLAVPEAEKSKSVEAGNPIILQCEISDPARQTCWYKDGIKLVPQFGINIQSEGSKRTLVIQSATSTCSGINFGCTLFSAAPPVTFVDIPEEDLYKSVVEQDQLVLSCKVSRADAVVQWYMDGVELQPSANITIQEDGTSRILTIHSAQLSDTGTYTCRAGDNVLMFKKLQESENIKLKIEGPYRRLKILCSGVEDSGEYICDTADDSIFFHLNITGKIPGYYIDMVEVSVYCDLCSQMGRSWHYLALLKSGVPSGKENYDGSRLVFCLAFCINLTPPVRFVRPRKMASGIEKDAGETLVLECEVSRFNAEVTWKKNGEEVEDSRNITILEDGVMRQLTIHSLSVEDAGQYVCDAKDDVMDFHVKVKEPPVKIIGNSGNPEQHILVAGDDLILECEVSRPNATVQWLWNGKSLKPDTRIQIDSHDFVRKLVLSGLQPSDSGEYVCDAIDDKMITFVEVQATCQSVTLCAILSQERANVRWLKDGQLLNEDNIHISSEGNTHKLTINPLQLSDAGEYVCDVNTDEMYFSLLVKGKKSDSKNYFRVIDNYSLVHMLLM